MYCSKCGQKVNNEDKFCLKCGIDLSGIEQAEKSDTQKTQNKKSGFRNFITGEFGLSKTFWKYGMAPVFFGALFISIMSPEGDLKMQEFWQFAFICIGLVYMPFFLIALWKASDRYKGKKLWIYLAKAFVILQIFNSIELVLYAQKLLQ